MPPIEANEDAQEAWLLRAGAELWKAVVAEADFQSKDTQAALAAVRHALDCARRLRRAKQQEEDTLRQQCDQATQQQMTALQQWGRGRGMNWDADWGTQWGEALSTEGRQPSPTCDDIPHEKTDQK